MAMSNQFLHCLLWSLKLLNLVLLWFCKLLRFHSIELLFHYFSCFLRIIDRYWFYLGGQQGWLMMERLHMMYIATISLGIVVFRHFTSVIPGIRCGVPGCIFSRCTRDGMKTITEPWRHSLESQGNHCKPWYKLEWRAHHKEGRGRGQPATVALEDEDPHQKREAHPRP